MKIGKLVSDDNLKRKIKNPESFDKKFNEFIPGIPIDNRSAAGICSDLGNG